MPIIDSVDDLGFQPCPICKSSHPNLIINGDFGDVECNRCSWGILDIKLLMESSDFRTIQLKGEWNAKIDSLIDNVPERIVAAATLVGEHVLVGVRHFDMLMHAQFKALGLTPGDVTRGEEGFITNKGVFVDREIAWSIAKRENQIIRIVGGNFSPNGKLFSENMW
ncbi:MAG: hypothetical protein PF450_04545 [Bacteroidales bacterium]|jgi:hypothetical protein|nr:hypothetical protein [Bacteroidales bacterium]